MLGRRQFLVRTGLALGAALLADSAAALRAATPPTALNSWDAVRAQFRLSRGLIHLAGFFLASHPDPVREAIDKHRQGLDVDPIGYWFANETSAEAEVLTAAAEYLGVEPTDIALTDSTTMGLGLLYNGLALKPGQEILTTVHDHYSTEVSLTLRAQRTGATVKRIPLYASLDGISADEIATAIARALTPQTRVVAVTWVHSSTGLKLPIRRIADVIARANAGRPPEDRALLCVDGVHGLGVENVALPDLGCDFFVAGTHKWMFGPRGTGLVWGRPEAWPAAAPTIPTFDDAAYRMWMREIPEQVLPPAAAMTPGGFHAFEHRWALGEAFRFHLTIKKPRVTERIVALNTQFKEGAGRLKGVTVHTPRAAELSAGIVCLDIAGMTPEEAVERLRARKIVASVTPYATKYLRVAPSLLTSPGEIDRALAEVRALARA